MSKKIVFASSNTGKIAEVSQILSPENITIIPQVEFNVSDADETGLTFIENAILKARHCARATGLPSIADDSGLEVYALNGQPGIYSARYAGEHGNNQANIEKLLQEMQGVEDRRASFRCVMVLMRNENDPAPIIAQGVWQGEILEQPLGENGFGYDPIFWVRSFNMTAAQLPAETKNAISHRGIALKKLKDELIKYVV